VCERRVACASHLVAMFHVYPGDKNEHQESINVSILVM